MCCNQFIIALDHTNRYSILKPCFLFSVSDVNKDVLTRFFIYIFVRSTLGTKLKLTKRTVT